MATCSSSTYGFSGYEVEIFRRAANLANLIEGMDYIFQCMPFEELVQHLKNGDGVCDAAAVGTAVRAASLDSGIMFSRATYRNGLIIAVPHDESADTSGVWTLFSAFSVEVWLAIAATAIGLGLLVYIVDRFEASERRRHGVKLKEVKGKSFMSYLWSSLGRPVSMTPSAFSIAGNFLLFSFCYIMMVSDLICLEIVGSTDQLSLLYPAVDGFFVCQYDHHKPREHKDQFEHSWRARLAWEGGGHVGSS